MDKFKVLEIKKSVFSGNEKRADELRKQLKEKKLFLLNLMSSPVQEKPQPLQEPLKL